MANGIIIAFFITLLGCIPLQGFIFKKGIFAFFKQWIQNMIKYGIAVSAVLAYVYMPPLIFPDILIPLGIQLFVNALFSFLSVQPRKYFAGNIQITILKTPLVILALLILLVIFSPLYPLTQTQRLHDLPGAVVDQTTISPMDSTQIRQVPIEFGTWKADKVIGDIGYKVHVGTLAIQLMQGKLYWVGALEFNSLWKWIKYKTTPGYVLVDAEMPDAKPLLVTDFEFQYLPTAFFQKNLHRHVYQQFPNYRLKEYTLEISESGKPFWVISALRPTIWFTGEKVAGVILVNPETGASSFFEEPPEWVDRVVPEYLAEQYNYWYGAYVNGYWNTLFSQKDMHVPTSLNGFIDVFAVRADNQLVWFTGHTSPSTKDKSLTGYATINTRTGDMIYYDNVSGYYNEEAAVSNANSKVSNFEGYRGSQPLFYNILGQSSWVIPVLSSNNILQRLAIIHAETGYGVVEESLAEALKSYSNWLAGEGKHVEEPFTNQIEGIIERTNQGYVLLRNSTIIFKVEGPLAALSEKGDHVVIAYEKAEDGYKGTITQNKNISKTPEIARKSSNKNRTFK